MDPEFLIPFHFDIKNDQIQPQNSDFMTVRSDRKSIFDIKFIENLSKLLFY